MQDKLFRKSALERLASPEQLDRLLYITDLQAWIALIGLALLVLMAILWGVAGNITITVRGEGVITEENTVIVFIPLDEAQRIEPGMETRVSPVTVKPETYGYIHAVVRHVDSRVATEADMDVVLGEGHTIPDELVVRVEIDLIFDEDTPSGYSWTIGEGPAFQMTIGTPAQVTIITAEERPITRVLGQ